MRVLVVCLLALASHALPPPEPIRIADAKAGQSSYKFQVEPQLLSSAGWVEVSWGGLTKEDITTGSGDYICSQDSYCHNVMEVNVWVGVFVEGADVTPIGPQSWPCGNPPWLAVAPIEWKPIDTSEGTTRFFVEPTRYNLDLYLFKNGTTHPVMVLGPLPVRFSSLEAPHAVHLARTQDPSEMRVTWQSKYLDNDAKVVWGTAPGNYTQETQAMPHSYSKRDLCGPPATTHGWSDPGFFYSAVITGVSPGQRVYYSVGSARGMSKETHFHGVEGKNPNAVLRVTAIADMGETYIDGAQYHWMEPYAINTTNGMAIAWPHAHEEKGIKRLALNPHKLPGTLSGREGPPSGSFYKRMGALFNERDNNKDSIDETDLVVHVGDLSYATGYETEWDRFMLQIEPIASRVPYMTGEGNHERDYPGSGSYFEGGDSGGECGWPTEARFIMPTPSGKQDMAWYSFDQGPAHFIMINTEMPLGEGSSQYDFVVSDLSAIKREETSWIIFMGHRPMYTGNSIDPHFQVLEPLLLKHQVDLCLWGHVHNAQRTCPVYNGTCITNKDSRGYDAPVHAVIGNAGQSLSTFPTPSPSWSLYEAKEYGYSTIEINGRESLTMKFYADTDNALHHEFTISRSSSSLPTASV